MQCGVAIGAAARQCGEATAAASVTAVALAWNARVALRTTNGQYGVCSANLKMRYLRRRQRRTLKSSVMQRTTHVRAPCSARM